MDSLNDIDWAIATEKAARPERQWLSGVFHVALGILKIALPVGGVLKAAHDNGGLVFAFNAATLGGGAMMYVAVAGLQSYACNWPAKGKVRSTVESMSWGEAYGILSKSWVKHLRHPM